jgi:hypothetical protein
MLRAAYPLTVDVPPAAGQSRRKALARPFLGVPIVLFSLLLNVGAAPATWCAIAARGRAPVWLADFQLCTLRWHARAAAYLLLVTDRVPTVADAHPVRIDFSVAPRVARWKVLVWKLVTVLPHLLGLVALTVAFVPLALLDCLAVVFTGRLPAALHAFGAGAIAYSARLMVYLQSLTDAFPPLSLRRSARVARRSTTIACAVVGLIPASLVLAVLIFIVGFSGTRAVVPVSYQGLRAGAIEPISTEAVVESGRMALASVRDPADSALGLFQARPAARYVAFEIVISNWRGAGEGVPVTASSFRLRDDTGTSRHPVLVGLNGAPGPGDVPSGRLGRGVVVFELAADKRPTRLTWNVVDYISTPRRGETIEWLLQ